VETAPGSGRKDPIRLRRFIEVAHQAGAALARDGWSPSREPGRLYDWSIDERA
jgi:hypothetical protein